jgi:hypothetical protein
MKVPTSHLFEAGLLAVAAVLQVWVFSQTYKSKAGGGKDLPTFIIGIIVLIIILVGAVVILME